MTQGRKGRELGIETKDMVNMSICDSIVSFITQNFLFFVYFFFLIFAIFYGVINQLRTSQEFGNNQLNTGISRISWILRTPAVRGVRKTWRIIPIGKWFGCQPFFLRCPNIRGLIPLLSHIIPIIIPYYPIIIPYYTPFLYIYTYTCISHY